MQYWDFCGEFSLFHKSIQSKLQFQGNALVSIRSQECFP